MRILPHIVSIALAATAASPFVRVNGVARPALAGPPLLCFPLDVGADAAKVEAATGMSMEMILKEPEKYIRSIVQLLDTSKDALVHMEALRRVSIAIHGLPESKHDAAAVVPAMVLHPLADRAVRVFTNSAANPLALLDYGYVLEALDAGNRAYVPDGMSVLTKASELAKEGDPAILLALAGASFMEDTSKFGQGGSESSRKYYFAALQKAPAGSLVRTNIIKSARYFLGEKTADEIGAK